jgi:hypothetical protein
MANGIAPNSSLSHQTAVRPQVTSYDSGYEYSLDRYVDVKLLLQGTDKEINSRPTTYTGPF